jgi:UDP-GlcNAc:undecaprenyl-phosphate GlcNAc-1-phosphate transferase
VHHKFLDLGYEHRFTVVIIYSLTFFWICSALLLRSAPEYLLLLFLLVSAALFYLGLRYVLRHQERFAFLKRDTMGGIRSSVTYLRMADLVARVVPGLFYLLIAYLLLALLSVVLHNVLSWQMTAILLGVGLYLWYWPLSESRQFLRLFIYAAVGVATMEVWHDDQMLFAGLSIKRVGDILLAAAGLIVILKIQFRRDGEFFLSTADYLALSVCVFLSIASQHNALGFNLTGPLLRAVIAMLMVQTLCSRQLTYLRPVAGITFVFLALVTVVGLIV